MKGNLWMEIRSEKKKGLSYAEMTRQTFHVKNTMIHGSEIIDYSIVPDDLSQYDSLIGGGFDE